MSSLQTGIYIAIIFSLILEYSFRSAVSPPEIIIRFSCRIFKFPVVIKRSADKRTTYIITHGDGDVWRRDAWYQLRILLFLHVDAVKLLHETEGILIDLGRSKYDGILQEINARMILYNFCELVTSHAVVKTSKNTKHVYKINFAIAVNIYRAYLKHDGNETETMLLIQKYLTPVRYNRKYPIHLRPKRNRDFMYRIA